MGSKETRLAMIMVTVNFFEKRLTYLQCCKAAMVSVKRTHFCLFCSLFPTSCDTGHQINKTRFIAALTIDRFLSCSDERELSYSM